MAGEKVVVIGAGFTGLVAARELVRHGRQLDITLVEKAAVVGGLAAGFPFCGASLEGTYHYLFLTDSHILGLVDQLGLSDRLIWGNSTIGVYLGGRIHPFTTPLDLLRFSPCSLPGRIRLGLTCVYLQRRKDWRRLVAQAGRDWLRRACGISAMETVWDPLLKGKFDRYYNHVSMAWLWARIHSRANSRAHGREKLGYFRGGFAVVTQKIEEELRAAGVRFLLNAPVERIITDNSGGRVVVNGEKLVFDRCLFSGPSGALSRLVDPVSGDESCRRQLNSIEYLGAICLIFSSDQDLSNFFWINLHDADAPFLLFIQHSRLVGTELYGGRHVYYLGCYQPQDSSLFRLDDDELTRRWFAYLKRMFPAFNQARAQERHVFRFSAAQHIVDMDYEGKIPPHRTPWPGVYLANFSQIFPEDRGTNFAVRDGKKVARLMLDDLDVQPMTSKGVWGS